MIQLIGIGIALLFIMLYALGVFDGMMGPLVLVKKVIPGRKAYPQKGIFVNIN